MIFLDEASAARRGRFLTFDLPKILSRRLVRRPMICQYVRDHPETSERYHIL